ncbi:acyltransferase family protein [Paenibacillus larvae]
MPEPSKGNRRFMSGLDGLRALAVLAVIIYHLNPDWLPGGFFGVGMFFVLSGYLVTDLLMARRIQTGSFCLKDFWVSRIRRLVPAVLVMLTTVVAWITLTDPSRLVSLRGDVVSTMLYANNWWLIFHQVSYFESFGPPSPFLHLWSLAVEGQFYLVWPLLLAVMIRLKFRRIYLLGVLTTGIVLSALLMGLYYEPGTDPSRVYYGTDTRVFALLIGALLAILWPSRRLSDKISASARRILDITGTVSLGLLLYLLWSVGEYDPFVYRGGLLILSAVTAVLIAVLAHPAPRLGKWLSWKPLTWIGVRSYGIYLWHYPVIILTNPVVNTNGFNAGRAVLQVTASILLAALSWRYIEEPIRRGALRRAWGKIRSKEWNWNRVPVRQWIMSFCAALVFLTFCLGMVYPRSGASAVSARPEKQSELTETASLQAAESGKPDTTPKLEIVPSPEPTARTDLSPGLDGQPGSDPHRHPDSIQPNSAGGEQKENETGGQKPAETNHNTLKTEKGWSLTAIGDSVMVDTAPYLKELLPGSVVDAKIGRQMSEAKNILAGMKQKGTLGKGVIIELGTNGVFNQKQLETLLQSLEGDVEEIVLVNMRAPVKWESKVNAMLEEISKTTPNVTLVDWYGASKGKDSYFEPDGTHLKPEGAKAYASLLAETIASL